MIDANIGGVIIMGDRGTGKSMLVRSMVEILPDLEVVPMDPFNSSPTDVSLMGPDVVDRFKAGEKLASCRVPTPLVELPLGATDDRVCGTIDISKALTDGVKALEPGLLAKANRGILYLDEVNLMDDSIVDVVLDSAAGGVNTVEREGISVVHPAKFIMIGSGDPAEGDLRPQMLDRFGLSVNVITLNDVEERAQLIFDCMAFESDPETFILEAQADTIKLRKRVLNAVDILADVKLSREIQVKISDLCSRMEIDGLRGDLVINRAAKALAAFNDRKIVTIEDVQIVIPMCLGHRLRTDPFDTSTRRDKILTSWTRVLDPSTAKNPKEN
jgi:Mg-chelatase subunit ChlI